MWFISVRYIQDSLKSVILFQKYVALNELNKLIKYIIAPITIKNNYFT